MKQRHEIEEKYKWDLSDICPDAATCIKNLQELKNEIPKIKKYENKLGSGAEKEIIDCLRLKAQLSQKLWRYCQWAGFASDVELANSQIQEISALGDSVYQDFLTATTFIYVEISELSVEELENLANNSNYKEFKRYFESIIRNKPHMLSKKEEILLSKMSEFCGGCEEAFKLLRNTEIKYNDVKDSKGKKHELTDSTNSLYMESSDRILRKNTQIEHHKAYQNFNNTISALYINNIQQESFFADVNKFNGTLEMAIFGEEASESVYKSLIETVNSNLELLHRIFEAKRITMGLDKFCSYDIYAPVTNELSMHMSFEDAIDLIEQSLTPLGKDYVQNLRKAVAERWFDVFETENKRGGGYCGCVYGCKPKILLNFSGSLYDVSTVTHEFGHAMHSYLSNKHNDFINADYTIFVAEVASTVNEILLYEHLIKNAKNKSEKIFLYNQFLTNMIYATMYRQTYFAEFEENAHRIYAETKILTKDILNDLYFGLLEKYMGENTEIIDELKFEWSRIPHFYSSFYVYKYATGVISALVIANNLLSENKEIREKTLNGYFKFLSSGSSLPPLEELKIAGVDLEDPKVIQNAFNIAEKYLNNWLDLIKS